MNTASVYQRKPLAADVSLRGRWILAGSVLAAFMTSAQVAGGDDRLNHCDGMNVRLRCDDKTQG